MSAKNYCGECAYLMEEDINGLGYCAMKELFTEARCGSPACKDFTLKTEIKNEEK